MVFSSSIFLFLFLPITLFSYYIMPAKGKNIVLLIASLFFYAWGEPVYVFLMLLSIGVNYALGLRIERENAQKRIFLILAVAYDLAVLFLFKYLNFTVGIINRIAHTSFETNVALPIGISFYTFQIMSYIIDVYRGNVKAQRSILDLALYVSLFPQLIAGPIVRYVDVEKQIAERSTSWEKAEEGAVRFAVGFSKKVLIADRLSSLVETAFSGSCPSILVNWVGILAYTLQIYFDFSGYSDMAIGLGKFFGFEFLENFNYPYISRSIQEFWRRWHISLSSWFRDYLYIPLGGSRKGEFRTYVNYVVVFFLTGLWHGASFNFIVWGLYYVVFLIIERLGWNRILKKLPVFLQHVYAFLIIMIGWVFFRADTLTAAVQYIKGMFSLSGKDVPYLIFVMNREYWFLLAAGIALSVPYPRIKRWLYAKRGGLVIRDSLVILCFLLAICCMVGTGYSPFLYFRF